jgi:hypothetical protein
METRTMDTRGLLQEYRELLEADPDAAERFLEEHRGNERFASIATLRTSLIQAFREHAAEKLALSEAQKRTVAKFVEAEVLHILSQNASRVAREVAGRVLEAIV